MNLRDQGFARYNCLSDGNLGSCLHGDLGNNKLGIGLSNRLGLALTLTLSKTDNAASDAFAHAFSETNVLLGSSRMLNLIVVIFAFVENHGAAENGVGATELDKKITHLVLRLCAPADRHILKVTNAAIRNVEVCVALFRTEWVINAAGGLASILKVTIFMNLHALHAWLDAPEASLNGSKITWLLFKLNAAARVGVPKEIELTGGFDSLRRLGDSTVIGIKRCSCERLDVARADGGTLSVDVTLSGRLADTEAITAQATADREDLATAEATGEALLRNVLLTWSGHVLLALLRVSSGHHDGQGTHELHFQVFRISYHCLGNKVLNKLHSTEIR